MNISRRKPLFPVVLERKITWMYLGSTSASIILRIAYGYAVQESGDPFVQTCDEAMNQVSEGATPGNFLVNIVPARELVHLSSTSTTELTQSSDSESIAGVGTRDRI